MMRIGESILLLGTLLACIPFYDFFAIAGILLVGLGCAPIYPAIIRSTPYRFSRRASQHVMGLQMAVAYCGNIVVSPLYGLIAKKADCFSALPYVALVFALLMLVSHEIINHMIDRRDRSLSDEEKKQYYLS